MPRNKASRCSIARKMTPLLPLQRRVFELAAQDLARRRLGDALYDLKPADRFVLRHLAVGKRDQLLRPRRFAGLHPDEPHRPPPAPPVRPANHPALPPPPLP